MITRHRKPTTEQRYSGQSGSALLGLRPCSGRCVRREGSVGSLQGSQPHPGGLLCSALLVEDNLPFLLPWPLLTVRGQVLPPANWGRRRRRESLRWDQRGRRQTSGHQDGSWVENMMGQREARMTWESSVCWRRFKGHLEKPNQPSHRNQRRPRGPWSGCEAPSK